MTAIELYEKLKTIQPGSVLCNYSMEACESMIPLIHEINELKKEKNAVVFAHSYVSPEITMSVADFVGDSFKLSRDATKVEADLIVFAAVRFMGETAKILNPNKRVLIPGSMTGCSLADSINADDMKALKAKYPEHTFVCYINTTAEVKAYCDVCVTSSNVIQVIKSIPNDKIVFVPDYLMGENIKADLKKQGIQKELVLFDGVCYVHEQYDHEMIRFFREQNPNLQVISHSECNPGVAMLSDYVGSTSQMVEYIQKESPQNPFLVLTECGLNAKLQAELPNHTFIGSCSMCKYMKSNSLTGILNTLRNPDQADEVIIQEDTRVKALKSIEAMFQYAKT